MRLSEKITRIGMNWINKIKSVAITMIITIVLYTTICVGFYYLNKSPKNLSKQTHNSNTIRATYPNYSQEDSNYAIAIFKEYSAPSSSYRSFVGFRRDEYAGDSVSIGSDGLRKSINHNYEESVWFLVARRCGYGRR